MRRLEGLRAAPLRLPGCPKSPRGAGDFLSRPDAPDLPPGMSMLFGCAARSPSVRNRDPRVGPWGEAMIDYPTECAEGTLVDAGLRCTTGCGSPEHALN